jgi:hypothetical protein
VYNIVYKNKNSSHFFASESLRCLGFTYPGRRSAATAFLPCLPAGRRQAGRSALARAVMLGPFGAKRI